MTMLAFLNSIEINTIVNSEHVNNSVKRDKKKKKKKNIWDSEEGPRVEDRWGGHASATVPQ